MARAPKMAEELLESAPLVIGALTVLAAGLVLVARPDRTREQLVPALAAAANGPADVVLIDSPAPGTGRTFDWSLAEGAPGGVRLMLAGGLNADNVAEAIRRVRPWGVDVATGVESAPGRKDARKLRKFILAAREAGEEGDDAVPESDDRPYDWELDGDGEAGRPREAPGDEPPRLRIV